MVKLTATGNCGVIEIMNISSAETPEDIMKVLAPRMLEGLVGTYATDPAPFLYFTGVVESPVNLGHAIDRRDDYGQNLADFITKHGLGVITQTPAVKNWTGNKIKIWVWAPDYDGLKAWIA